MRTLIGIISYMGDAENGKHQKIRDTWGKDVSASGADLFFFIGRRDDEPHRPKYCPKADEIPIKWEQFKDCKHGWWESIEGCCVDFWQLLVKEILLWSIQNGYDYSFLCENDTFLVPQKLMSCGFEKYDFSGHFINGGKKYPWPEDFPFHPPQDSIILGGEKYSWPEPGVGYFLSKKAAKIIIDAPSDHFSMGMYAGQVLGPYIHRGEIIKAHLPNFIDVVSWHYRTQQILHPIIGFGYPDDSNWQKEMYEKHNA
jgi:hypothetical protein